MLRLTQAADGLLARIRLPGGLISAGQLRVLARLADGLGDGRVELTSRANLQLRSLSAEDATMLTAELTEAGLLPSLSHDQVRNILASPLAGLDGGLDLSDAVRHLDAELCARPRLADLPGRFLFALDDGRGDVSGLGADVVATVRRDDATVNGLAVGDPDGVVAVMLACAEAFLDLKAEARSPAWRIADLPGGAADVRTLAASRLGLAAAPEETAAATAARPVGLVAGSATGTASPAAAGAGHDWSAVLVAPLGRLTCIQLIWLADRLAGQVARVTPWRSVVLPHVSDAAGVLGDAAGLGFGTDETSAWLRVTACAGRPGCASALADVQADAAGFAARWPGRVVHVSGCARHCGRPAATEINVTATSEGYQVAGA